MLLENMKVVYTVNKVADRTEPTTYCQYYGKNTHLLPLMQVKSNVAQLLNSPQR